jgi:ethanolamine ammonia-lyase small subunit
VHEALDLAALVGAIEGAGLQTVHVRSTAPDRATYLLRPDLGRRLDPESHRRLRAQSGTGRDAVIVLADGLAARAAMRHGPPLLSLLVPWLEAAGWRVGPVVVAEQARVALGDEIGAALGAHLVAILLGERPGLSAPDSLGAYLTWDPRPGRTDAERNCVSNIRPEGLGYAAAAGKLVWLMTEARARRVTGVSLKDDTGASGT